MRESPEASAGNVSPSGSFSCRVPTGLLLNLLSISQEAQVTTGVIVESPGEDFRSRWQTAVVAMGFTDFVSPEDGFRTLGGDLWPDSKSSGVYSWVAENGEAYVGQAVSVRRRLLDRWKVHRDILAAAFMRLDRQKLDEIERTCIRDISKNFSTRNIKHAISTSAFVPFDTFMTDAERQVFLFGSFASNEHVWRDLGVLEQKQATKFRRLEREG
jgi:hypothetical protein